MCFYRVLRTFWRRMKSTFAWPLNLTEKNSEIIEDEMVFNEFRQHFCTNDICEYINERKKEMTEIGIASMQRWMDNHCFAFDNMCTGVCMLANMNCK